MPGSLVLRLRPRATAFATIVALLVVVAPFALAAFAGEGAATALRWCRDRVVAAAATRGEAVVTIALAAASLAALVAMARLGSFLWSEVRHRLAFEALANKRQVPAPRNVRLAADAAEGIRMQVIADARPFALAVGILRPRIVVSDALAARCTLAELRAVIAHEAAHCRARHPFAAFAWEAFDRVSAFAPVVGDVAEHLAVTREVEADAVASARFGRRAVAAALLKATEVSPAFASVPFGRLTERAVALSQGTIVVPLKLGLSRIALTILSAAFGTLLVAALDVRAEGSVDLCPSGIPAMSSVNFSPYLSITVPQMSAAPPPGDASGLSAEYARELLR